VQIVLPAGYVAASEKLDVTLTQGQRTDLPIAARRGEKAAPAATPTALADAQSSVPARLGTILIVVVAVVGALVVLTIIALVVIRRRV
jgi:hypothetical protein